MQTSSGNRIGKYQVKMINLGPIYQGALDVVAEGAKADYASLIADWVQKRDMAVHMVCSYGEPRLLMGAYLAFSGELWKMLRFCSGNTAAEEGAFLVTKYQSWGLTLTVLDKIKEEVFNLQPPVGP